MLQQLHNLQFRRISGDTDRRGFSLIEITATIGLMGLLAAVSSSYFTKAASQVVETTVSAHTLQLELERLRHLAIQTGDPHGVRFKTEKGQVTQITSFRRTTAREMPVSGVKSIPPEVTIRTKGTTIVFNSEGSTDIGRTLRFETPTRNWQIDVVAVTGSARIREL